MPDPVQPRLRVRVTDGRGRPIPSAGLDRWLASAAPARARGKVTIALLTQHSKWVSLAQVPYFIWVSLATVLQMSITWMNWGRA